jgi:hypothetical protein
VVISSNLQVTNAGRPYTKQAKVLEDPGVAVYFRLNQTALVLACDRWLSVAENMAAIAGHIEAIRAQDRYGVGSVEQAFAGYKALPADTARDWRHVFGFKAGTEPSMDEVDRAFKALARGQHPDSGGSHEMMAFLNRARDFARTEIG